MAIDSTARHDGRDPLLQYAGPALRWALGAGRWC